MLKSDPTETDATAAWIRAQGEKIMRQYPLAKGLDRLGQPSDIAQAVLFFASPLSNYVSGQMLLVDGGVSTRFPLGTPGADS